MWPVSVLIYFSVWLAMTTLCQCLSTYTSQKAQLRAPLSPLQTAWTSFDPYLYRGGSSSAGPAPVETATARSFILIRSIVTDIMSATPLEPGWWAVHSTPPRSARSVPCGRAWWSGMHCSPSWLQGCGWHCVSQNVPDEYKRPCSCCFQRGLLRMTHRYISKGRSWSRLFVRERVELLMGGVSRQTLASMPLPLAYFFSDHTMLQIVSSIPHIAQRVEMNGPCNWRCTLKHLADQLPHSMAIPSS